jgi:hypothetical protein
MRAFYNISSLFISVVQSSYKNIFWPHQYLWTFQLSNVFLLVGGSFDMQDGIPVLTEVLTDSFKHHLISRSQPMISLYRLWQNRYPYSVCLLLVRLGCTLNRLLNPSFCPEWSFILWLENAVCGGAHQSEPKDWFTFLLVGRIVPLETNPLLCFWNIHLQWHSCI